MVQFFVSMIRQDKLTLEQVPEKWRETVEQALSA